MRKLGLRTEAAVARVELREDGACDLVHEGQRQIAVSAGEALVVLDGGHHAGGRIERLFASLFPHLRHGEQHAAEARAAIAVVAGEVSAAEVGATVGSEKGCEGPAALPADGGDSGLVAGVHVGALIPIDLHRHVVPIDDGGHLRVFIRFPIHDVAPVAPDRADIKQDGFVFFLSEGKGGLAPRVPLHGLVTR